MIEEINKIIQKVVKSVSNGLVTEIRIEYPRPEMADVAICCTSIAALVKKSPTIIATDIAEQLSRSILFDSVTIAGPYVNIRFNNERLFYDAIQVPIEKNIKTSHAERIMVEYLSPNTNKPLHLGHIRNGVIGSCLANLLAAVGHIVIRTNLINDRGIHICKSMLAYQLFGNSATPESTGKKGDHFVGDWYVRYGNEEKRDLSLKEKTENMLFSWEKGDTEIRSLWTKMNQWMYAGFAVTTTRFKFYFDRVYYESELYQLGKENVQKGLDQGIFVRDKDGALRYPLSVEKYGVGPAGEPRMPKVLNADGTSVYMTQDIGIAIKKVEDFNLDRSIYVVASEQKQHFQALFDILKSLGYSWADKCFHLSYGMVELPDGRMKSREGTSVDADNLADEMALLAQNIIIEKTSGIDQEEVIRRAEIISITAISFFLLHYRADSNVIFDIKKSLSFDGDTGPYCLYTYARARNILERVKTEKGWSPLQSLTTDYSLLTTVEERALAIEILRFPEVIKEAANNYEISLLPEQMIRISKAFNRFYRDHQVIGEDEVLMGERLALVAATAESLKWGFSFFNVVPLERM